MLWVGALVQSIVFTVALIVLGIGWDRPGEAYQRVVIGVAIIAVVSWIIFGWLVAYGR